MTRFGDAVPIEAVEVRAYNIPTDPRPESDGTAKWASTPLCTVHVTAGGRRGFGYGYIHRAGAVLIEDTLAPLLGDRPAMDVAGAWETMRRATRNIGQRGLARSAIGAVDIALWDLKARLLDVSVATLLGARRERCAAYASGGFTSQSFDEMAAQLTRWVEEGFRRVKIKVGRHTGEDVERVRAARAAIGPETELFVDANGAYTPSLAIDMAHRFAEHDIVWFEEPVSSHHLSDLRRIRQRVPPGIRIAAGEYGSDIFEVRRMCEEEAVDVVQPDPIRAGGFTGFLRAAEVCDAFSTPISAHTAPQLAAHVCCAAPGVLHLEWFHDHARIDRLLFDGAVRPDDGFVRPDRGRPGIGIELKEQDAEQYRVH